MDSTELDMFDVEEDIEPCRACGIYFISNQAIIQPIFENSETGDNCDYNMPQIVKQMNDWNLGVNQNDGRPQYMCLACIGEFQKLLNFKRSCVETQEQFDELDYKRLHNGIVIKKEIEPVQDNEKFCGFIYLDTDDEEEGSEEDGSRRVCAPLDIPHVPIKEEHAARVPQEMSYQPAVALPEEATFSQVKPQELAVANGLSCSVFEISPILQENPESDDEIIKFTYEDESEELLTLPVPIKEPGVYCKLCGHASLSQNQHVEHMSRIHMLKDCECHICGKKFVNAQESRIRFHMKWHKLQKHLKCPICGFFCNSKDTLKEHKLAVHTRAKCQFCGKQMKHKQLEAHLNRHIQEHEDELARKLRSMQTIEKPENQEQPEPKPDPDPEPENEPEIEHDSDLIQCAFCEFTTELAEDLQDHVLTTHRANLVSQSSPPKEPEEANQSADLQTDPSNSSMETSTNAIMDISSRSIHSDISPRPKKLLYNCHLCGKAFDLQIKLNRHVKLHSKAL